MSGDPLSEKQKLINNDRKTYTKKQGQCCYVKQRYVLVWMMLAGYLIAYAGRVNLSVAIVAMVNQTYVQEHDAERSDNNSCPNLDPFNNTEQFQEGEFKWTQEMQGVISGSFYYGAILSQLLGGILADRFGGKHIFGFGVFLSSVMTILVPTMSRVNVSLLIANRILGGCFQGVLYSALATLLSVWSPIDERGFLFMLPNFGIFIGIAVSFPVTGWLCREGFAGGWPSAFYIFGLLGCIWLLPWLYLTSSSPATHRRISDEEKLYIQISLGTSTQLKTRIPWKSVLTSIPVYTILASYFMANFSYMSLLTFTPTYLNEILKFDIVSNGLLSIVPYIASALGCFIGGVTAERLSGVFNSVTLSRKFFSFLATFIAGICMFTIPVAGCSRTGVIALLTASSFFQSFNSVGYYISPLDIAPRYAGCIMGLANTVGTVGFILGPYVTGALTNTAQNLHTWALAFYVMGACTVLGGVIFLLFGTAKVQPWAVQNSEHVINEGVEH